MSRERDPMVLRTRFQVPFILVVLAYQIACGLVARGTTKRKTRGRIEQGKHSLIVHVAARRRIGAQRRSPRGTCPPPNLALPGGRARAAEKSWRKRRGVRWPSAGHLVSC